MNKHLQQEMSDNKSGYLHYHAPRYDKLLSLLGKYHTTGGHILDIGRSSFTKIAQKALGITDIDTLGFEKDGHTETGYNYQYDLNRSQYPDNYRQNLPKYDIIICAEVIEHLYTSPALVLEFLKTILTENGLIIIQTPNPIVLHKRVQFLLGINPFMQISKDTSNPGHFREYTMKELIGYCAGAGFYITDKFYENYFDYRYTHHTKGKCSFKKLNRIVNYFYQISPFTMRPGLCLVIKNK